MAETKYTINETMTIESSGAHSVTVSLPTGGKFVDRDIDIITSTTVKQAEAKVDGSKLTVSTGYVDSPISTDVQAGSLNNAATQGVSYTADTTTQTIIPAGGSLYINAGYYPNTSITLGHMIPDDEGYDNAGNGNILSGYEAYDTNGNKLVGTIPTITPSFTGGGVTATASGTVTTAPKVEVKAGGTFVTTSGYGVTTSKPSGTDGTNYLTIDGSGTPTNGTVTAKADASSADVTYSEATTGYVDKESGVVAIDGQSATQATAPITVTPTVTDSFAARYIPIVEVSHSGGTISATVGGSVGTSASATGTITGTITSAAGVSTSKPSGTDGSDYISISPNVTKVDGTVNITADAHMTAITYTNSAGAIAAHSGTAAKDAQDATRDTDSVSVPVGTNVGSSYYMSKSTVGSSASITTPPSVAVSGSASGFTASDTSTTHYVTVNGSASNGTAASTYTASAGFTELISNGTGGTATIIPTVTGDLSKVYIPDGAYSASLDSHSITKAPTSKGDVTVSSSSASYTVTTLSTAPTDAPYITITPTISAGTGTSSAKAKATIGTAGYVETGNKTMSSAGTATITVSTSVGANQYIEIYDGTYTKTTT